MEEIYQYELSGFRKDSARSLSEYRLRKHMESKWAAVIIFLAMPFYMLANLSNGKKISLLAGVAMSFMSLTSLYA